MRTAVALGAIVGATVRWAVTTGLPATDLPWTVLAVNVVGSLVLGLAGPALTRPDRRALVGVGFCGGLTTFSSFALDTAVFLDEGRVAVAGANLAATLVLPAAALAAALAWHRRRT